ncbi:hypothetical protein AB0393_28295 [Streptomyces cyaneofuscatus]|uniref:hypothetical protein n=1 Tax=Streptomyces cyaneofuscatus TaxID=66883 RepID=UPI00344FD467
MPEEIIPSPLNETVAAVAAACPGLRRVHPHSIGVPGVTLADVRLDPKGTARYTWAGYEVLVTVGHEAHLDRDAPDSTALHREVRAQATLLLAQMVSQAAAMDSFGHVEWEMTDHRPELVFPAALAVATADTNDPRFASAVLATIAKALEFARIATGHAAVQAERAADEVRWESERPPGVRQAKWARDKRKEKAERDSATQASPAPTLPASADTGEEPLD